MEPNPDWWKELKGKNRKAWILPHCISLSKKVELVDFDVSAFIGGVINPDEKSKKPSDISREGKKQDYDRTIKVFFIQTKNMIICNNIIRKKGVCRTKISYYNNFDFRLNAFHYKLYYLHWKILL